MDIDLELLSNKNKLKKNNIVKDNLTNINLILNNILELELIDDLNITQLLVNTNKILNNIHKKKDVNIIEFLKLSILIIQHLKKKELISEATKDRNIKKEEEIKYICKDILEDILHKVEEKYNTKNILVDSSNEKVGIEKYIIIKSANQ